MSRPSIAMRVGTRIRELREAQGLSQRDLAKAIGMARSLVGYVEAGTKVPTLTTVDAIAQALGVSLADLVADETPERGTTKRNQPAAEIVPDHCRRLLALLRVRGPEYVEALERVVKIMDRFAKAKKD